jgi:hypothetical protein
LIQIYVKELRIHSSGLGGYKRDVYLGWPIGASYMSPNAGGVAGSQPMSTAVHMKPK